MSNTIYGYARVSTVRQDVNRQIKNIKDKYPDAIIFGSEEMVDISG